MRPVVDLAYRLRRWVLARLRWPTWGVKVMVFDPDGALLLIRNRYGNSAHWVLPGGGIGRREAAADAAVREVREETGCRVAEVTFLAAFESTAEGKRDTILLFRGTSGDQPVADGVEVSETRFFAMDELPAGVSPATRRRIEEWQGKRTARAVW